MDGYLSRKCQLLRKLTSTTNSVVGCPKRVDMKVIGTAGHIDHGKSTLVRRLTGIDPDRLEEEKRRGMTIDLGFAWLDLPSGRSASIVDVPGHERFVKNMLAGAGGIDVGLLVVAADEGVMPQTLEHLDIMDLLEVRAGVVALSKSDLVDDEMLALIEDEIEGALSGTSLENSKIVPVSATSGVGLPQLLAALDSAIDGAPPRDTSGLVFLPVDRSFSMPGFGTVVTGTLMSGTLTAGQSVEVSPRGGHARIRSLQTHRRNVEVAEAGARVAVNLSGVDRKAVARGDVLTAPGAVGGIRSFDAKVRVVRNAPFPLEHGVRGTLHLGAAERQASVSVLNAERIEPGESGWVTFRLTTPVATIRGQRFVLRLPAPARTIAGGVVVDVAPSRRKSERVERLALVADPDLRVASRAALDARRPVTTSELARRLGVPSGTLATVVQSLVHDGNVIVLADSLISSEAWKLAERRATEHLVDYHARHPLKSGMPKEELRRNLAWPGPGWAHAIRRMESEGAVRDDGRTIALPAHVGGTSSRIEDAKRVLSVLSRRRFSPPLGAEVRAEANVDESFLHAMADERQIVRVGAEVFFTRDAYDAIVGSVVELIEAEGSVTVARLRDQLGTSRKYALALLEHLDSEHVTRRRGDVRVLGGARPVCA
jgi:selenocysteine-specific elongation factor